MSRVLFLATSVLLNLALLATLFVRPSLAPPAIGDAISHFLHPTPPAIAAPPPKPLKPAERPKLWPNLDTHGDLPALVARLRAAGFPASVIRSIVSAEVGARYDARMRAYWESDPTTPYWKLKPSFYSAGDKRYQEMNQLQRERAKLLRDLFADPFFATDAEITAGQRRQFGSLSRSQIDAVQRIEDDYAEMTSAIRAAMGGITLPEDREKLALLAREKHADLAALLSPEELADYELRSSPLTTRLGMMLGTFNPTEAEFRTIFQAQQALNDRFPAGFTGGPNWEQDRQAAQQQFYDQLRAGLGDARLADYLRETDREYLQLKRIAQQQNLPPNAASDAFAVRASVEQESMRIFNDPAMSNDDKRAALQTLSQTTRDRLLATLGPSAGPTYVKVADSWLNAMSRGAAVSFSDNRPMMIMDANGGTMSFSSSGRFHFVPGSTPGR